MDHLPAPFVDPPSASLLPAPPALQHESADERARAAAAQLDSRLHALAARFTNGLSPIALTLAYASWAMHLATQPAQASRLALKAQQGWLEWAAQSVGLGCPPASKDPRFKAEAWQHWPWPPLLNLTHAAEDWWHDATALRGMCGHHQEMTRFFSRQWLDMVSPANWGLLNPQVLERTLQRQGGNLVDGTTNALESWRKQHGLPTLKPGERAYQPGVDVAITPGRVVHRNHLVELIQYEPTTTEVQAEPVFIVPSWIMKYYILDLSPENSMVKWLVSQGHTVFILSWRNPDESDALLSMADYLEQGVFDPLAAIARLIPGEAVHACGYCLGGTLLSIGAAALARPGKVARAELLPELKSITLLATETDFSEPGEMGVLIDETQVALLEDMMAERGFLTGSQMAGSFAYLHSRELVWSQKLSEFWLGEANEPNDLMAWNADTTRMPAVMHSEYLRRCYLRNELAQGRFPVEDRPVALSDIEQPMFVVGTEKDHVSPWRAVYKIHRLADCEITFVLTNAGHNAGIVSEPGHPRRHYALRLRQPNGTWVAPEHWAEGATQHQGSWWLAWHDWLLARSRGSVPARTPLVDEALGAAPGRNVAVRYYD